MTSRNVPTVEDEKPRVSRAFRCKVETAGIEPARHSRRESVNRESSGTGRTTRRLGVTYHIIKGREAVVVWLVVIASVLVGFAVIYDYLTYTPTGHPRPVEQTITFIEQ